MFGIGLPAAYNNGNVHECVAAAHTSRATAKTTAAGRM